MSRTGSQRRSLHVLAARHTLLGVALSLVVAWGCTTPADLPDVNSITIGTQDSVLVGGTIQLHPLITDVNGRPISGHKVTYQALNPAVATVDENGLVTGVQTGGALFRVSAGGLSVTHTVRVLAPVTQVVISGTATDLPVGQTRQLVATLTNASGQSVAGRAIVWSSLNPSVAVVNAQGVVSAIAVGTAQIRAGSDYDQKYGTATVTVSAGTIPIASITFGPAIDTLIPGDPKQFNPVVKDAQGNTVTSFAGRNAQPQTSNQPVASVSVQSAGVVVTANNPGTATITLTLDNVISNNLVIHVVQVSSIQVTPNPVTLTQAARTQQLTVLLKDANGNTLTSTRPITFQSQNITCVTVSATGLVTALYPATACPATVQVNVSAGGVTQPVSVNLN